MEFHFQYVRLRVQSVSNCLLSQILLALIPQMDTQEIICFALLQSSGQLSVNISGSPLPSLLVFLSSDVCFLQRVLVIWRQPVAHPSLDNSPSCFSSAQSPESPKKDPTLCCSLPHTGSCAAQSRISLRLPVVRASSGQGTCGNRLSLGKTKVGICKIQAACRFSSHFGDSLGGFQFYSVSHTCNSCNFPLEIMLLLKYLPLIFNRGLMLLKSLLWNC